MQDFESECRGDTKLSIGKELDQRYRDTGS